MTREEAIKKVESQTCYRVTAMTTESAFFVPVGSDGETVIGPCFELSNDKILKLAKLKRPKVNAR